MVETTEPRYATLKAGLVRRVADGLAAQGDADATDQAVRLVAEFEDRVAVAATDRSTSRDSEVREAIEAIEQTRLERALTAKISAILDDRWPLIGQIIDAFVGSGLFLDRSSEVAPTLRWPDMSASYPGNAYSASEAPTEPRSVREFRALIEEVSASEAAPVVGLSDVYAERNRIVAALAHLFGNAAWRGLDPGSPDFTVVYIDLPTGQVSWHIPDAEMAAFPPLPLRDPTGWDGHDTDEKYRRLAALRRGDICRDVAEAVQLAVNHERELAARLTQTPALGETPSR